MMRRVIVLAACVALGVPVLPGTTLAGGKMLAPARASFKVNSDFRPKSAFGGPGGFPLPIGEDRHGGLPSRRMARHAFVPRFPATTFLYAPYALYGPPSALYEPPAEPSSPVVSVAPVIYVSPTVYLSPPVASPPPVQVAAAPPPAPPPPSVVEHPTGRYELRGDGVSAPYTWVWIPNPPSAPPAAPPSREESAAASVLSASRTPTYRWTDEDGTSFWTNRLETVPESYRSRARAATQP